MVRARMRPTAHPIEHLYLHVPFCAAKCKYCAFYSEAGRTSRMGGYVDAVLRELDQFCGTSAPLVDDLAKARGAAARSSKASGALALQSRSIKPVSVFFGGGTPSILPVTVMRRLLEGLAARVPLDRVREWTIECNPATVTKDKARLFREAGVNRISLGVQALDDALLKTVGRIHSVRAAVDSYKKLRAAGFENINLDLMFGLPGQTPADFRATLERAIELQPEHIATYCLILEEDTEFGRRYRSPGVSPVPPVAPIADHERARRPGYDSLPDDDQELAMYQMAIERLGAAGYRHYEISNFAKPGRDCVHNIAYWEGRDYLGLGPSACSTLGDRRWQNVPDIDRYVEAISHQQSAVSFEEHLTKATKAGERVAFGMRMLDGVPANLVRGRWDREIAELLSAELVRWRNGRLQPTPRGVLFADAIASEFV